MERIDQAKKLFMQARKMTLSLALSVGIYGVVGYYLVRMGKAGPAILNAPMYPLAKYGALIVSVIGIFMMRRISLRMTGASQGLGLVPAPRPQKLLLATIVMCAAAELPVLLGMLLMFFGHQVYDYIPFAAVALVGFVLAFPKKQQWSSWLGAEL